MADRWTRARAGQVEFDSLQDLSRFLKQAQNGSIPMASTARDPVPDSTLAILLPLLILFSSLLFLLLLILVFLIVARRQRGIQLPENDGPLDLGREEELEGQGGLDGVEQRWLDTVDESVKTGYIRAKAWQAQFPPNSQPTDITLTQFLSIQEKGVSAWAFEPDFETISPPFLVTGRTEIMFLADGIGMANSEGGGACVQCNLPLPKINEVYYWEAKLFEKPESTVVAVGLATKPYPSFRLPGWSKYSVGYFSSDGFKSHNYPFTASSYGPPLLEGDVIGVGYRPRTGTVFFTRNGKKLEDAYVGLNRYNLFPTVGANGAANIQVNLGQSGFVFIEANVKKWGLAPSSGTLAPPPAYGSERGSILLETANGPQQLRMIMPRDRSSRRHRHRQRGSTSEQAESSSAQLQRTSSRDDVISEVDEDESLSTGSEPSNVSDQEESQPLSVNHLQSPSMSKRYQSTPMMRRVSSHGSADDFPANPPTPNVMDISLQSLRNGTPFYDRWNQEAQAESSSATPNLQRQPSYDRPPPTPIDESPTPRRIGGSSRHARRTIEPPAYNMVDPNVYAPGVAEAMLGDSFAAFQAASGASSHGPSQSLPTQSVYEGRTSSEDDNRASSQSRGGWFGFFRSSRNTSAV